MKKIISFLSGLFPKSNTVHDDGQKGEALYKSQSRNILPPQECQRRLKLLNKVSISGSPLARFQVFPTEYFRRRY